MPSDRPICFMFDKHEVRRAASRARAKTGKRIAANMAMMAITTSSSIRVKPDRDLRRGTNIVLPPFLADDSPSALPAPPHHSKRIGEQDLSWACRTGVGFLTEPHGSNGYIRDRKQ